MTTGRPARLATQASVPGFQTDVENTRWRFGGATTGTAHVVGSHGGLEPWSQIDPADRDDNPRPDRIAEVQAREAAAVDRSLPRQGLAVLDQSGHEGPHRSPG